MVVTVGRNYVNVYVNWMLELLFQGYTVLQFLYSAWLSEWNFVSVKLENFDSLIEITEMN